MGISGIVEDGRSSRDRTGTIRVSLCLRGKARIGRGENHPARREEEDQRDTGTRDGGCERAGSCAAGHAADCPENEVERRDEDDAWVPAQSREPPQDARLDGKFLFSQWFRFLYVGARCLTTPFVTTIWRVL